MTDNSTPVPVYVPTHRYVPMPHAGDQSSYTSDNGVDRYIEPLLPEFGYACEVGANNGLLGSNCFRLETKGWVVLCIEPNPMLEEEGRRNRKLWRQVAAGARDGDSQVFMACGGYPWGSYSSLVRDGILVEGLASIERTQTSGMDHLVSVRTLDRLIEEAGFPRLDLLTIDVEGWENDVMAGFTIERWKPTIIVREDWDDGHERPEYPKYEHIQRLGVDNIYRRLPE